MAGKDVGYFPHYINARNDRKLRKARLQLGIEAYAIYFMTLEVLREQKDYKYPLADLDILSDDFGTTLQKVQVIVLNYGLFDIDPNEQFFSHAQKLALKKFDETKELNRLKGIKSGRARRLKAQKQISELKQLENFSQGDSIEPQFNNSSSADEQVSKEVSKEVNEKHTYTIDDWLNEYCVNKSAAYKADMKKRIRNNDPEAIATYQEWEQEKMEKDLLLEEKNKIDTFDYSLLIGLQIGEKNIIRVVDAGSSIHLFFDDGTDDYNYKKKDLYEWYQSKKQEETA
ncbi:MAG: DUF4373 domain-containing protein [Sulfurovum sp.]|nr:DUF4373 domain-containing protein [Sulfurovum sp.]MDD3602482.1 DUF4373 domain-containing protein [Sulfurovum sp.]